MNGKFDSGLNNKTIGGVNEMYNIEKELRNIRDRYGMWYIEDSTLYI